MQLEKWGAITFSNEVVQYNVSASVDPVGSGSVTGAGTYNDGASCTLVASPASGKVFQGWYNGAQLVSSSASYTFVVTGNLSLTAKFGDEPVAGFSNVKAGTHNWNSNLQFNALSAEDYQPYTGNVVVADDSTHVAMIPNSTNVGASISIASQNRVQIQNNAFSIANPSVTTTPSTLAMVVYDNDNDYWIIRAKFDYTVKIADD